MRRIIYHFYAPPATRRRLAVVALVLWLSLHAMQPVLGAAGPKVVWSAPLADAIGGRSGDHLPAVYTFDRTVNIPDLMPGGQFVIAGDDSGTAKINADDVLDIVLEDASDPPWVWTYNFDSTDGKSTVPISPVPVPALRGLVQSHISLTDLHPPLFGIATGLFLALIAPAPATAAPVVRSTPTAVPAPPASPSPASALTATTPAPTPTTPVPARAARAAVGIPTDTSTDIGPTGTTSEIHGASGMSWRQRVALILGSGSVIALFLALGRRVSGVVGEILRRSIIH